MGMASQEEEVSREEEERAFRAAVQGAAPRYAQQKWLTKLWQREWHASPRRAQPARLRALRAF